jgi:hypothetical protein
MYLQYKDLEITWRIAIAIRQVIQQTVGEIISAKNVSSRLLSLNFAPNLLYNSDRK